MTRKAKPARKKAAPKKLLAKRRAPTARRGQKAEAIDVLISAGADALALPIEPDWRAGVRFNLRLIFAHAAGVDEFALVDDCEPAPVFHA